MNAQVAVIQGQTPAVVRQLEPTDAVRIGALLERTSPESRLRRFLAPMPRVNARTVALLADPGPEAGGVVAVVGDRIVGIAHHGPIIDGEAEVAILVEDAWQGRGIGKLLMGRLLGMLALKGARTISGSTFRDNAAAIGLLEKVAGEVDRRFDGPSMEFRASFQTERYLHPAYGTPGARALHRRFIQKAPFPTPVAVGAANP